MNSCNFTGRLTKMPEVRKTSSGLSVCRFRLAVRRTYKTDGEYKTDFLDFVAWDKTAELIGRYYGQGQLIAVKAAAQTRSYENKRGDRIVVVEFMVNEVESLAQRTSKEEAAEQGTQHADGNEQDEFIDLTDEDLPF